MSLNDQQKTAIDWSALQGSAKEVAEKMTPYANALRGMAIGSQPAVGLAATPITTLLGALIGAGMGGKGNRLHGAIHGAGRGFGTAVGTGLGGLTMGAPIGGVAGYFGAPVAGGGVGAIAGGGAGGFGGYGAGAGLAKLVTGEDAPWTKKKDKKENKDKAKDKEKTMASEKSARVYEAAEHLDGAKPKVTMMNHKCCTPGEFGMRVKEAAPWYTKAVNAARSFMQTPAQASRAAMARHAASVRPPQWRQVAGAPSGVYGFVKDPTPMVPNPHFDPRSLLSKQHVSLDEIGAMAANRQRGRHILAGGALGGAGLEAVRGSLGSNVAPDVKARLAEQAAPGFSDTKPVSPNLSRGIFQAPGMTKTQSARDFGAAVKLAFLGEYGMPALGGAAIGAGLGGLAGIINPGEEDHYDDNGKVIGRKQRSRLGAALSGALAGGLGGGALGAGAQYAGYGNHIGQVGSHLSNHLSNAGSYLQGLFGPSAAQTNAQTVKRMQEAQQNLANNEARMTLPQYAIHQMAMRNSNPTLEQRRLRDLTTRKPFKAQPGQVPTAADLAETPTQLATERLEEEINSPE